MATRIQIRRDTAANWAAENPTLAEGEPGLDLTNDRIKYGDGSTPWNTLPFSDDGDGGGGDAPYGLDAFTLYCTDRITPIPVADNIYLWPVPYAMIVSELQAYLENPAASGTFTIRVNINGVTVLTTNITIDAGEDSSLNANVPAVIATSSWQKGDRMTVDVVDDADGTASGLILNVVYGSAEDPDTGEETPPTGDVEPPTVPTGLAVTDVTATTVSLSWDPSTDNVGVNGYTVQRATDAGFSTGLATIVLGNVTSYVNSGLSSETQYFFRVLARDASANASAYSSSVNATTEAPPFVPYWDTVAVQHEELETAPVHALEVVTAAESTHSIKNDLGVDSVGDYVEFTYPAVGQWDFIIGERLTIGYRNGAGEGAYYDMGATVALASFSPAAGDVFRVVRLSGGNVEVRRNGSVICYALFGDMQPVWTFKVRSYASATAGTRFETPTVTQAASSDLSAPTAPGTPTFGAVDEESIVVNWTAATDDTGVTGYLLQRATDESFATDLVTVPLGAVLTYADTGLEASTTYYYRVRARDAAGNISAASATANETTDAEAFTAWWDTVDPKHTEKITPPLNALVVNTAAESGFSTRNDVGVNSVGDYVEFVYPADGAWTVKIAGRAKIGDNNGNPGIRYDDGSEAQEATFSPAPGDVYRVTVVSGNNMEIKRNGATEFTSTSGDAATPWGFAVQHFSSADVGTEFLIPTVTQA